MLVAGEALAAIARYLAAFDEKDVPGMFLVMFCAMILLLLYCGELVVYDLAYMLLLLDCILPPGIDHNMK